MKHTFFFVAFLWAFSAFPQQFPILTSSHEQIPPDLAHAIDDLFNILQKQDLDAFNKQFIHPEHGLYDINQPGAMGTLRTLDSIPYSTKRAYMNVYPTLFCLEVGDSTGPWEWDEPRFICDVNTWEWEKQGFFVRNKPSLPSVPFLMSLIESNGDAFYSDEEKEYANWVLESSFRVVVTKYNLSFFLTRIDGQWYMTVLDRITWDCSA